MSRISKTFKIFLISILILLISNIQVFAFNPNNKINVHVKADIEGRNQIDVVSLKNTNYINFFIDQYWWNQTSPSDQNKVLNFISLLSSEFEYNIYPKVTKLFPDISKWLSYQEKLTVVLSPMKNGVQGYVRWDDFNSISQSKTSNDGNIIYFNPINILNPSFSNFVLYSFFSHELMHLITYYEKNLKYRVEEDTWLEELRSEYLPHYLGYNKAKDSYLAFRLQNWIKLSDVNIVSWDNSNSSYSLINLFSIYLNQRFSSPIFFDTIASSQTGVESINQYLIKNGFKERFHDIYRDWIITGIINDCTDNPNHCYDNIDIGSSIPGTSFFLPTGNDSVLSISDSLSNYQVKYQKILGGSDNLEIILENPKNNIFQKMPYVLIGHDNKKTLNFFEFNNQPTIKIKIPGYSQKYKNIVIIPMYASNEGSPQLFKWHINSNKNSTTNTTIKPIVRTTTTTSITEEKANSSTTTTQLKISDSSPIIINIVSPEKTKPFFTSISLVFRNFFQKIVNWIF